MKATVKGNTLFLEITLADKPSVSKSEQAKAEAAGRQAVAKSLATTGGFILASGDRTVKVSANVITA